MFMLIIWLQGIWLPQHGVDFDETPLLAGICMLPLTVGMLASGPTSGILSDRYGARGFATGGMIATAFAFVLLWLLPTDFAYLTFAAVLLFDGHLDGDVRLTQPRRGDEQPAATGPRCRRRDEPDLPEQCAGAVGRHLLLADDRRTGREPAAHAQLRACTRTACRLPRRRAIGKVPPVSVLFAAFLGYNPVKSLVGTHVLDKLLGAQPGGAHRPLVLPAADLLAVPRRPAHGLRVRDRRVPRRGRRLGATRRRVPPQEAAAEPEQTTEASIVRA